ncbi:MAG: HAMP domain-containing sensor histidine kinase [Lachnospira sp.]|nr:HAMP domain-containing sensor histidine kinase [Lachnospira sp.]
MRSTLYLKFFTLYMIFGFLSIFTVSTLASVLITSHIEKEESTALYTEASLMGTDFLPDFFSNDIELPAVYQQLQGISTYNQAAVWLVSPSGELLAFANGDNTSAPPTTIKHFNPAESGSAQYEIGTYHGCFDEDMMTVIAPVTQGFTTPGYLLIHKSYDSIINNRNHILRIVYIITAVIYVLSFSILLAVHFLIYVPLRRVTEAATQYASGNLEHEIRVSSHDEMGYLSASLNYMSAQLRDMEDYQKTFVANVSHDFRSPLTSIKGYVEAMTDGTIPPEMHEKYLKIILFETDRLTDLTKDLLALNEYDTKHLLLNLEPFDLHEAIKNTAASFEGTCTEKKISIELLLATKKMLVTADKRKIQQVLYNLLDNAIKFSEPDSTVTIETTERGDKVFTSIKDRGMGIPRDNLNKVWERFYKSDLSRGKDKKGTGLGLAIVKEAINSHNEKINVVSTEGVGTEFTFSLTKAKE